MGNRAQTTFEFKRSYANGEFGFDEPPSSARRIRRPVRSTPARTAARKLAVQGELLFFPTASPSPRAPRALRTAGTHHDLAALFDELNARYFRGSLEVPVTWGRPAPPVRGRRQRSSITLGSYCAEDRLVRVHPALDEAFVPRFFVEYILFHEMLHHVMPMPVKNGRRQTHTPAFRAEERRFSEYARAVAWEKRFLDRLLSR